MHLCISAFHTNFVNFFSPVTIPKSVKNIWNEGEEEEGETKRAFSATERRLQVPFVTDLPNQSQKYSFKNDHFRFDFSHLSRLANLSAVLPFLTYC